MDKLLVKNQKLLISEQTKKKLRKTWPLKIFMETLQDPNGLELSIVEKGDKLEKLVIMILLGLNQELW
jgi:hypothetical protein